jgi:hypothetical protein
VLLDFRPEADAFLDALVTISSEFRREIGESIAFWKKAVGRTR